MPAISKRRIANYNALEAQLWIVTDKVHNYWTMREEEVIEKDQEAEEVQQGLQGRPRCALLLCGKTLNVWQKNTVTFGK